MDEHTDQRDEWDEAQRLHPGLRSYVATDAEFRALVERGLASGKSGPNLELAVVFADIRSRLLKR